MTNLVKIENLALCLLVLLCGCATEAGYQKFVGSWKGATKHRLIEGLGTPTNTYKEDEHIEYFDYIDSSISTDGWGRIQSLQCKTTFTLTDNIVTSWRYEGNNCQACNDGFWGPLCKLR